ncbi:MAG: hypothetical protein K9H64_23260 [Bacteroidales bacterium]|nr:hypothetical protein [Bacteroidales bacterium]MCF8458953.1 hypothetical protein [Bacteroidales bacterium]
MYDIAYSPILCYLVLAAGLVIFFALRIIEIDYLKGKIRNVIFIFPIKIGQWRDFSDYTHLILKPEHENIGIWSPGTAITTQIFRKRYVIYLINENDSKKKQLLVSCRSISKAQLKLDEYSINLGMEKRNLIKEGWQKSLVRRRRR